MFLNRLFHRHNDSRAELYHKIAVSFFSISVVVALIIFFVSFSWATVTITPVVKQLSDTVSLTIQDEPLTLPGAIPGKIIHQELEGEGTFSPSEVSTVQDKATGVITVFNQSAHAQQLRATTRFLSSNNLLFRSTAFSVVPAHGQADVPVGADASGDPGDLHSEHFTLPGLHPDAQKAIYGISFVKGAGGAREVRTVTNEDITRATGEVEKKLEEKFALMLDTEKTKVSAPSVLSTVQSTVMSSTADHAVGQQAKEFTERLKVRFTAVLYDEQKFGAAVHQALLGNLSSGYQLIDPLSSDIQSTFVASDETSHSATISSKVTAGKIRTDDLQAYHKKDLVGLSKDDIMAYFRGYDDISNVSVAFYPFWVKHAPLLVDHITIHIQKDK